MSMFAEQDDHISRALARLRPQSVVTVGTILDPAAPTVDAAEQMMAAITAIRVAERPAVVERKGSKIVATVTTHGVALSVTIDLANIEPVSTLEERFGRRHECLDLFTAATRQAINALLGELDELAAA